MHCLCILHILTQDAIGAIDMLLAADRNLFYAFNLWLCGQIRLDNFAVAIQLGLSRGLQFS